MTRARMMLKFFTILRVKDFDRLIERYWDTHEKNISAYTLVIYLSDTTLDAVHAAADEMIEVFHQSSVMIQENPTRTEFYSPANP